MNSCISYVFVPLSLPRPLSPSLCPLLLTNRATENTKPSPGAMEGFHHIFPCSSLYCSSWSGVFLDLHGVESWRQDGMLCSRTINYTTRLARILLLTHHDPFNLPVKVIIQAIIQFLAKRCIICIITDRRMPLPSYQIPFHKVMSNTCQFTRVLLSWYSCSMSVPQVLITAGIVYNPPCNYQVQTTN